MRSGLPPHVFACMALCAAAASAQPEAEEPPPITATATAGEAKPSATAVPDVTVGPTKIAVTPVDDGSSHVTYTVDVTPDSMTDVMSNAYAGALKALKSRLES